MKITVKFTLMETGGGWGVISPALVQAKGVPAGAKEGRRYFDVVKGEQVIAVEFEAADPVAPPIAEAAPIMPAAPEAETPKRKAKK